ncbi:MAG: hypothetical protein COZ33_09740 [Nitrospirae bacterium CG_4_10_14_3_um_filter_70_108]|nr:MAG: hypothetical protein COZ33_09740 [Nitrospirae bacterium CG_4_10_14_3_um_filter_70_108]
MGQEVSRGPIVTLGPKRGERSAAPIRRGRAAGGRAAGSGPRPAPTPDRPPGNSGRSPRSPPPPPSPPRPGWRGRCHA